MVVKVPDVDRTLILLVVFEPQPDNLGQRLHPERLLRAAIHDALREPPAVVPHRSLRYLQGPSDLAVVHPSYTQHTDRHDFLPGQSARHDSLPGIRTREVVRHTVSGCTMEGVVKLGVP
jgi:hypothetical protein